MEQNIEVTPTATPYGEMPPVALQPTPEETEAARQRVYEEMAKNDCAFIGAQQKAREEIAARNEKAASNEGEWKIVLFLIPILFVILAFLAGTGLLMKYFGNH